MSSLSHESTGEQPDHKAQAPLLEELRPFLVEIEKLPPELQSGLRRALEDYNVDRTRRRRILDLVQDALSQLRVDMKYLMFDLEATRRERDTALKQQRGEENG